MESWGRRGRWLDGAWGASRPNNSLNCSIKTLLCLFLAFVFLAALA